MTRSKTKQLTFDALCIALLAACAWICVPLAVPVTLQTFSIFYVIALLGGKRGTMCIGAYILLGTMGIPVFSGMQGGFAVLAGPTGGYLAGFFVMSLFLWMTEALWKKKEWLTGIFFCIGLLLCYGFGTIWFIVVYTKNTGSIGWMAALSMCVIPFIVPDLIKIALAILLAKRTRRQIQ